MEKHWDQVLRRHFVMPKKIAQGRRKLSVIFVPMKIPFESYWRVVIKSWL